jgi:hypothetical protein
MALALILLMLGQAQEASSLPRKLAQDPLPPVETPRTAPQERPIVDFDWLELSPSAGFVVYSSKYRADPEAGLEIRAHVPMPWLSPADDPIGEYFGLYASAGFAPIDRELSPTVSRRRGLTSYYSLGLDYSFLRDESWILLGRAGIAYAYYGGVADLKSGFGPTVGLSAGYHLSGKLALTYNPELIFGDSGSLVFFNTLGLLIQF